jgi:hypothetical protein
MSPPSGATAGPPFSRVALITLSPAPTSPCVQLCSAACIRGRRCQTSSSSFLTLLSWPLWPLPRSLLGRQRLLPPLGLVDSGPAQDGRAENPLHPSHPFRSEARGFILLVFPRQLVVGDDSVICLATGTDATRVTMHPELAAAAQDRSKQLL